jgi:hypothetical protein
MRRSVYPVDALSVQLADNQSSDQVAPSEIQRKYWVCEVGDAELSDDSFVVVSPLGDFDQESLPVRADRAGMGTDSTSSTAGITPDAGKQATSKEGA